MNNNNLNQKTAWEVSFVCLTIVDFILAACVALNNPIVGAIGACATILNIAFNHE